MRKKKARLDEMSMSESLSTVKVAMLQNGFPKETMDSDRLRVTQDSIMEAYEGISVDGPQVRFANCMHRPGYLLITCADEISTRWLREVTPTLQLWKGASLKTLGGGGLRSRDYNAYTGYVPNESGLRLEADRILTRFRVGNKDLNTSLWTVFGKMPAEKGQLWTFSMDKQSMEELKRLDLCPHFGMGRIKVRPKEQKQRSARKEVKNEGSQEPQQDIQPPPGPQLSKGRKLVKWLSPLKRLTTQKPIEVEEVSAEDQPEEGRNRGPAGESLSRQGCFGHFV